MPLRQRSGPPLGTGGRLSTSETSKMTSTPSVTDVNDIGRLILTAAELVDTIGDTAEREADIYRVAWQDGFRVGFEDGADVGYTRTHHEVAVAWSRIADHVRSMGRPGSRTHAELVQRRSMPGGPAYHAAIIRHNGTEFGGVGKPRVPAPPEAVEAAAAWALKEVNA